MPYQVIVTQVEPQLTAVVRCRVRQDQLSKVVPDLCGEVWRFIRSNQLPDPGRHLALYLNGEIDLECGAEIGQPFQGDGRVMCSQTPAGRVATTTHWGSYDGLHGAHEAICEWIRENSHPKALVNWEVYGHWDDDPSKVRTDVFYLLD
jgi:effector-binding domain-containing protein